MKIIFKLRVWNWDGENMEVFPTYKGARNAIRLYHNWDTEPFNIEIFELIQEGDHFRRGYTLFSAEYK